MSMTQGLLSYQSVATKDRLNVVALPYLILSYKFELTSLENSVKCIHLYRHSASY